MSSVDLVSPQLNNKENIMASKHPGFAAVESKIARQKGVKDAGAILASATRNASAAAKRKNPNLKRVKGK